jgi:hypothetical protein
MFVQLLKPHSKSCWVQSACFKRRLGAKTRTQNSKTSQHMFQSTHIPSHNSCMQTQITTKDAADSTRV